MSSGVISRHISDMWEVVSGQARFIPPGSTRSSEGAKHAMTGGGCELCHNLKQAASTP